MMVNYQTCRFTAKLYLLHTAEGGRATAFRAGATVYRPQFQLTASGPSSSCFVDRVRGQQGMSPGEERIVEMTLLHPEYFPNQIISGTKFEIYEGTRAVGRGTILDIQELS